jgi:hypothetical protein
MTSSHSTSQTEDKPLKACEENADTSYMNTPHTPKLTFPEELELAMRKTIAQLGLSIDQQRKAIEAFRNAQAR